MTKLSRDSTTGLAKALTLREAREACVQYCEGARSGLELTSAKRPKLQETVLELIRPLLSKS